MQIVFLPVKLSSINRGRNWWAFGVCGDYFWMMKTDSVRVLTEPDPESGVLEHRGRHLLHLHCLRHADHDGRNA